MTAQPFVTTTAARMVDQRPPSVALMLDIVLRNPGDADHWFLIPDDVAIAEEIGGGTVNGADVRTLTGSGRVVITHFQGLRGFYALLLPAGGEVTLRDLQVDADLDALEEAISLPVERCTAAIIGGRPIADWAGDDPACDRRVSATAVGGTLLAERWPPGFPELPVEVGDGDRLLVPIELEASS